MANITIIDGNTTTVYEDICHITPKFRSKEIAILQREDAFEVIYLCGNMAEESLERYIADSDGPCDLHEYYILQEVYSKLRSEHEILAEQYDSLDSRYKASKTERDTILKLFERLTILCAKNVMSKEFNEEYVLLQKEAMEFFNTIEE